MCVWEGGATHAAEGPDPWEEVMGTHWGGSKH